MSPLMTGNGARSKKYFSNICAKLCRVRCSRRNRMMGATPMETGLEHDLRDGRRATGTAPSRHAADGRRWLALALVCLASLLIVLDGTIVNVALPTIQRDLGFTQASLAWVVNAYLLTFGGLMLVAGRAADLLGRRRILMAGIALFTLSSLA